VRRWRTHTRRQKCPAFIAGQASLQPADPSTNTVGTEVCRHALKYGTRVICGGVMEILLQHHTVGEADDTSAIGSVLFGVRHLNDRNTVLLVELAK
jgi:hypothetical protein